MQVPTGFLNKLRGWQGSKRISRRDRGPCKKGEPGSLLLVRLSCRRAHSLAQGGRGQGKQKSLHPPDGPVQKRQGEAKPSGERVPLDPRSGFPQQNEPEGHTVFTASRPLLPASCHTGRSWRSEKSRQEVRRFPRTKECRQEPTISAGDGHGGFDRAGCKQGLQESASTVRLLKSPATLTEGKIHTN